MLPGTLRTVLQLLPFKFIRPILSTRSSAHSPRSLTAPTRTMTSATPAPALEHDQTEYGNFVRGQFCVMSSFITLHSC